MKKIMIIITLSVGGLVYPIVYRDGCTKVGDFCNCGSVMGPGLPDDCYESGFCFKGYQYGDESVYCQCHGHVLSHEEVENLQGARFDQAADIPAAEKNRLKNLIKAEKINYYSTQIPASARLQTDSACAARPKYGYDGQGFGKLIVFLKQLADRRNLFIRGNYMPTPPEQMSTIPTALAIKSALGSLEEMVTKELAVLYSSKTKPSELPPLVKIYERENRPAEPCLRFKEMLKKQLKLGPDIEYTKEANELINATCGQSFEQTREDLDPCICSNTKTPGVCRVNLCVNPGVLRCHCD